MTTRPNGPARRLAFSVGKSLSDDLRFIAWASGRDLDGLTSLAAELGRGHYLHALSKAKPSILRELKGLTVDDHEALVAWARRWRLPAGPKSWAVLWAQETIRLSGARYWCPPNPESSGSLIDEHPPSHRLSPSEIKRAAPLVDLGTFVTLVRFQVGEASYTDLAERLRKPVPNVRRDVVRLARLLDLPLRRTSAGQPRKKRRAPID